MARTMNSIDPMAARLAAQGVNYAPEIVAAAQKHGLDPNLLAAVAAQETGGPGANGGRNIVGDGGHGHGLFQIDDRWHDFASTPGAMDPAENADYAATMLAGNLQRYGGDVRAALSAYNAGSPTSAGTQTTWADGSTLGYADSVLRHEAQLEAAKAEAPADFVSAGALQQAALAFPPYPGCTNGSTLPGITTPWQPPAGLDSTGHQTNAPTNYDSYINGGDS
jgi:soluble lytic murein transglycosylase-like protein